VSQLSRQCFRRSLGCGAGPVPALAFRHTGWGSLFELAGSLAGAATRQSASDTGWKRVKAGERTGEVPGMIARWPVASRERTWEGAQL